MVRRFYCLSQHCAASVVLGIRQYASHPEDRICFVDTDFTQNHVDASQIAKDLSFLNIKGKTRIGYQVETLATELSNFLGFHNDHTAFMIGAGSLGSALIQDSGLMRSVCTSWRVSTLTRKL